ncbi:CYTH domain-containing protein [Paracoccus sp. MBLB3053]|uniref:CYTH domain-containing protein n=1 Tax=Paracoccus aurantius TaxID=3073814 RepID=A0ABU2HYB9_9RHOB|nr:CYTH domain-containing protein [Paracoccus sp. MBLB3053]MDS9470051.1 CYTH domain-containing protein [Paracoccus sp. MBLB3053]
MAREIERKFLVATDGWKDMVLYSQELRDGLILANDGRKLRVRIQDDRALLTVKGARDGIVRDEFEYPIPMSDAQEMLDKLCGDELVEKTRHHVKAGDMVWTVDVYRGLLAGIIIAEIELPEVDHDFPIPSWVGREVTGLQEYRKVNLAAARRNGVFTRTG